ncbi:RND superfamily putative drug exporter [Streptomyces sp. SAI-208]|uniref:MMPL family transporter n=1 Tax=unclassified Streptomyces TaxID=2593676 RepID=UPI002474D85F|nr:MULTISPECIES: MMPL family transporter [unclassified Streptomyces]MDH6517710.1 RND superfamily putative drug exporter [Streptomyces sp. SAI-090]MDH6568985.1 RND superfamily putative drug exporter [Streptomyces sp. SAI-117]MDH6586062.1 RND superfamily putative drug exporter [Streptomyces sp. SAI-133]MDH6608569.1 RND superfamily putative drug exporter [Streptomyces sp. SAI-208]MDH6618201.1 RND superfamily putative drug exporter [Streptomyces sp. SAI-135]
MATFLYRVGRLAFRRRWYVALVWAAVLAAVGLGALKAPGAADEGFSMPGIESQKAFDLMEERFPGATADGATARVVFVAPKGEKVTAAGNRKAVEDTVADLADGSQVASAVNPFQAKAVSADGTTAYATVTYDVASNDLTDASRHHLEQALDRARDSGLTVDAGGTAMDDGGGAGGAAEIIGVAIAAVVLLVTFGSLAAAGLPLLTAIIGVGVSMATILALSDALGLSTTTGTLAMMLGLAVGIDYALFVVSRYREERANGRTPQEATSLAVGTAGSAVVFAGLTVVIALAGLSVVGIPMLTKMGLAAAGAVVVAVFVALTLVPAFLGFWPNAVLRRKARRSGRVEEETKDNGGTRWARFVLRRPLPVLILGVVGLGALALPMTSLQLGMPGDEAKPTSTTERRAYDALAEGFGPGFNGPLTVVVDAKGDDDAKGAASTIAREIGATEGVVSVSPARFNASGDTAVFSVVPSTAPTDERTKDLVTTIRGERPGVESATGATFEVTGTTALNIDISEKVQSALVPYLVVVVGLAVVLLLVVFRSLLVPLKAALGFLLSVLASLGAVVVVFQQGHGASLLGVETTGPIMSLMPIFLVGIVFGLAMDYEVFLVSRMRESYVHGETPAQAVTSGFRHSARVVVAAALIMIAVFAGFIGESDSMIKMIGFGLATAVLLDAFVVRMALVPAVLALLGDRAWWLPKWLDRTLPHVDVEGEALTRPPTTPEPTPTTQETAHV